MKNRPFILGIQLEESNAGNHLPGPVHAQLVYDLPSYALRETEAHAQIYASESAEYYAKSLARTSAMFLWIVLA